MSDIALKFDPATASCDWTIGAGEVLTGGDLETAVLVSLFTDRVLPDGQANPDGSSDPRGWWADTYRGSAIGSLLWTLERAVKSDAQGLLATAQKMCLDALGWMIEDGVAARVEAKTYWLKADALAIEITITEPTGRDQTFKYSWAWAGI